MVLNPQNRHIPVSLWSWRLMQPAAFFSLHGSERPSAKMETCLCPWSCISCPRLCLPMVLNQLLVSLSMMLNSESQHPLRVPLSMTHRTEALHYMKHFDQASVAVWLLSGCSDSSHLSKTMHLNPVGNSTFPGEGEMGKERECFCLCFSAMTW